MIELSSVKWRGSLSPETYWPTPKMTVSDRPNSCLAMEKNGFPTHDYAMGRYTKPKERLRKYFTFFALIFSADCKQSGRGADIFKLPCGFSSIAVYLPAEVLILFSFLNTTAAPSIGAS